MDAQQSQKTDRRIVYTKNAIKTALLELMQVQPFSELTVAALCRQAEITRATFYLRYPDLTAVLDELISEALELSKRDSEDPIADMIQMMHLIQEGHSLAYLQEYDYLLPACQYVADNPRYRPIFNDTGLIDYVLGKIIRAEQDRMVPCIMRYCNISWRDASSAFRFAVSGAFALNRAMKWEKNLEWYHQQGVVLRMVCGGFDAFAAYAGKQKT